MKQKYEFRKKALDFATVEFYDSVKLQGIYDNYEVYTPCCKKWKEDAPKIGLPQVILVNENEIKWGNPYDPFSILNECKKIPSIVFEYNCMCWYGNSYNVKLFGDGTLLKVEYGYSKLGPNDRIRDDSEKTILQNQDLVKEIKGMIKENRGVLKKLPRELSNWNILDGAQEFVRFGRMKFEGVNMFEENLSEEMEHCDYKTLSPEKQHLFSLYEMQKIFSE